MMKHVLWNPLLLIGVAVLLIAAFVVVVLRAVQAASSQRTSQEMPHRTSQGTSTSQPPLLATDIDTLLTASVKQEEFSGSVLVARDDQILLSKGYSMANWDHQMPNTPQTRFYLGSTTKQFTAMAILILQQRGKLHLQESLCSFIPQCPSAWQPVTIHDLLTHTSGITQLDGSVPVSSPQAWISRYDDVPLAFRAGGEFNYCNVCYQILGYVVEQASGEPYSVFLQQAIFGPLRMQDTGFDPKDLFLTNRAIGYATWQVKADSDDWVLSPGMSFLLASGLLHSTVEDLYLWDQALYTNTLIPQKVLAEAFTPYVASQYAGSGYGYGWFITRSPVPGHRLVWHDGRTDGFRTYIGHYPDDRITIIILSNLATVDEFTVAKSLEQINFAHMGTPESN
jgi:CubicO group peptidase (beta-lactamase class C family)